MNSTDKPALSLSEIRAIMAEPGDSDSLFNPEMYNHFCRPLKPIIEDIYDAEH